MCILILFSYKTSNIVAATPGLFAIPIPTIDTLDIPVEDFISSISNSLACSCNISSASSKSCSFTVNDISFEICSPKA